MTPTGPSTDASMPYVLHHGLPDFVNGGSVCNALLERVMANSRRPARRWVGGG